MEIKMEKLKKAVIRLLYPGAAAVICSVPVGAGLLAAAFLYLGEEHPVAYVAYVVSAYSLTAVCANLVPLAKKIKNRICQIPVVRRYREDIPFKIRVSLHISLGINLLYAGMHGFSGFYYRSVWFVTLSVYYIFLSVMRFLLVRYIYKKGFGGDREGELRRYRLCGILLILMNLALSGVVVLELHQSGAFHYAELLIYGVALYAFYMMISAVANVVRYRKHHSPLMSAAKIINLAAAMVSMLSLETAMLTQFDDPSSAFRQMMIGVTGGIVCAAVVGMGIGMVVSSTKKLKKTGENENNILDTDQGKEALKWKR